MRSEFSGRARLLGAICLGVIAAVMFAQSAGASGVGDRPAGARVPRLVWHRCSDVVQHHFQCATVRVPLDYRDRRGRKIKLAVIRHRATNPSRRVGTLFYNPGGPAAAKPLLPQVIGLFPRAWVRRFDVVTWDLRGLGQSTPVRCFASQASEDRFLAGVGKPALSFPVGAAQRSRWIRRWAAFGRHCQRRSGDLLPHVSTADSAKDMDLLRRAVSARQVTYVGASYGTFLGATYANLFPNRIRAMLLIAALDPAKWVSRGPAAGGAFSPTYVRQGTARGSRMTLNAFLRLCGRTSTARCAFSAGSAAATREKFTALLRRLPRNGPTGSATYANVVGLVANEIYVSAGWGKLATRLQDLWTTGSAGAPIEDRFPGIGGTLAINCSDSPNPGPDAFQRAAALAYRRSGAVGSLWAWATEPCATWPATAADRYSGPWNHRTAKPVLVVSTTHDPASPYHAAVALTRELGRARLLTVDGYGHGVRSACAYRIMTHYLINQILPPPRRARCSSPQPFTGGN